MHYSTSITRKLAEKYKEISLLGKINALLGWDMNVNLPPKASSARAEQSAYLAGLVVDKWVDPEFRNLLEKAESKRSSLTQEEKAMIRNLLWGGKYYWKVPKELVVEFTKTTSEAFMAWHKAKTENNFSLFSEYLQQNIRLSQKIADHLGYKENRYDALLDLYEMGLTTTTCKSIFTSLTKQLKSLVKEIQNKQKQNSQILSRYINQNTYYSRKRQKELSHFILKKLGYDLEAGRLDVSPHPFTTDLARHDVRITTNYLLHDFRSSFTATIHEAGHGMYELGINESYENTPLGGGVSLGIHESQSRFWENQIGRSKAFISYMTPIFQAYFSEQLGDSNEEVLYQLFNSVTPGPIRIEADEVTYNLHIALRFELEEQLINEQIKVSQLPEIWNSKMKDYLGIVPKTVREGVLQDVHWSYGNFGYFPTYTLGNLNAAQITDTMKKELNLDSLIKNGEFGTILSWLRQSIHRHGSLYWPDELIVNVTGKKLTPDHFIRYIKKKYLN